MINVCFTGHRPDKLGGYDWNSQKNKNIMYKLLDTIESILVQIDEGTEVNFIGGGALGIDQMSIHIINQAIKNYYPLWITTEIAVPFKNQAIKWFNQEDVQRYNDQLEKADKVTYVDRLDAYKIKGYKEDIYYPAKMQKRNEYMVDNSDIVVAVWDGTKGGTGNCVRYAEKQGKKIIVINPKEI
jgi:uncharacterized phage-like protein YoqJ